MYTQGFGIIKLIRNLPSLTENPMHCSQKWVYLTMLTQMFGLNLSAISHPISNMRVFEDMAFQGGKPHKLYFHINRNSTFSLSSVYMA